MLADFVKKFILPVLLCFPTLAHSLVLEDLPKEQLYEMFSGKEIVYDIGSFDPPHPAVLQLINNYNLYSNTAKKSWAPLKTKFLRQMIGRFARRTAVYIQVHEDSRTNLTKQMAKNLVFRGAQPCNLWVTYSYSFCNL